MLLNFICYFSGFIGVTFRLLNTLKMINAMVKFITSNSIFQVISINCSEIPYSPSNSLDDNEYSHDLDDEDIELNNVKSPASFFNISSRAPLHSLQELDSTLEDDIVSFEEVIINKRKRKFEDSSDQEHKSSKIRKLWNIMKYPFQKITTVTLRENGSNVSNAELIVQKEPIVTQIAECKNNDEKETEEINTPNNSEIQIENNSECITNTRNFCSIM